MGIEDGENWRHALIIIPTPQIPLPLSAPSPINQSFLRFLLAMLLTILLLPLAITRTTSLPLSHRFSNATTAFDTTIATNITKATNAKSGDGFILNFALTLEYLQRAFYEGGIIQKQTS